MDVSLPRTRLAVLPTPLVRAPRLERALDAGPLFVKRDDMTGFGFAGNKARALEFLVAEAVAGGSDVFVTGGSPTSNFCAAAAMAAEVVGIDCHLLFPDGPVQVDSPNVSLARAAGARLLVGIASTREQVDAAVVEHATALRAKGRRPYAVPRGGATPTGAVGYALAARELDEQCEQAGIDPRTVVVATGSGGTQAGLLAGRRVGSWHLVGASVSRPAHDVAAGILRISRACAAAIGLPEPDPAVVDVRDCRGAGFGLASPQDRRSARLARESEGLMLDYYYGAKAMTLFRTLMTTGEGVPAVFWHTGGTVAALTSTTGDAA